MSSWTSKPTARGQVFALSNKTSSRAGALYVDEAEGSTTSRPKSSKKVQSRADAFKAKATAALEAGASQKRAKGGPSKCTASLAAAGLDLMWPPARDQPGFDYRVVTLIKSDSTSTSFDLIGGLLASSKAGKGDKKKTSSRAASATSKAAKPAKSKEGGGMPVAEEETSSGPGPMPRTKERIMTFKPVSSEDMEEAGKRPTFPGDYVYSETEDEVEDYDEDLRQRMARGRRVSLCHGLQLLVSRSSPLWLFARSFSSTSNARSSPGSTPPPAFPLSRILKLKST